MKLICTVVVSMYYNIFLLFVVHFLIYNIAQQSVNISNQLNIDIFK